MLYQNGNLKIYNADKMLLGYTKILDVLKQKDAEYHRNVLLILGTTGKIRLNPNTLSHVDNYFGGNTSQRKKRNTKKIYISLHKRKTKKNNS